MQQRTLITWVACLAIPVFAQDQGPILKPKPKPAVGATILVVCDLACNWSLDGEAKGTLPDGGSKKALVSLGQHLITAQTQDGLDKTEKEVNIKTSTQTLVRLEFQAARVEAARQQAARDAAVRDQTSQQQRNQAPTANSQPSRPASSASTSGPEALNPPETARALGSAGTASIHGYVRNAAGQLLTKGDVKFTTEKGGDAKSRKYPFSFPIEGNGNYKGTGLPPGNYLAVTFVDGTSIDFVDNVKLVPGDDKAVDFDMTRKEYLDKMTPEERKQLENFKKQNTTAMTGNAKIVSLNNLLTQARADTKSGNYDRAIASMKDATAQKSDEPILWVALGDAELGAADVTSKAAKAAGRPMDTDTMKLYNDATDAYKKSIELNAISKKPSPDLAAASYNNLGQAYVKLGNATYASVAFEGAVNALPAKAGIYYFNEAATMYNAGRMDEATAAADKAIAADPNLADAYFIKGQALIQKAMVNPKTNKIVTSPGCLEAYQMYLQLAPNGSHANEVRNILQGLGESVQSTYKVPTQRQ